MLCRWDYGYQTTAMANRTVLVDNNTWNNTHIATVGRAMASPEKQAWEIFRSLDCTHVLVIFGGFIGYAPSQLLASGTCTLSLKQAVALIGPLIRAAECYCCATMFWAISPALCDDLSAGLVLQGAPSSQEIRLLLQRQELASCCAKHEGNHNAGADTPAMTSTSFCGW